MPNNMPHGGAAICSSRGSDSEPSWKNGYSAFASAKTPVVSCNVVMCKLFGGPQHMSTVEIVGPCNSRVRDSGFG